MTVRVKICGITSEPALAASIDSGADFIGLVFYPRSPRHLSLEHARHLRCLASNHVQTVALVVDPTDDLLQALLPFLQPDYLQLHGQETPERVRSIRQISGLPIIKAVKIGSARDVSAGRLYEDVAEIVLFDAQALPADALPGGNGIAFDWRLLQDAGLRENFMLSGGLNPENVAEAIHVCRANAVDVSSGVEIAPGEKSPDLIHRFIRAARSAQPQS